MKKWVLKIVYFDLPALKFALPVYYLLARAEASSNLGRYDGIRYGYKTEHYEGIHDMICKTRSEALVKKLREEFFLVLTALSAGYYGCLLQESSEPKKVLSLRLLMMHLECLMLSLAPTVPMTAFKSV